MSRQTQVSVGQAPAVEYLFPHSVEEAVRLLLDGPGETRILAGGTAYPTSARARSSRAAWWTSPGSRAWTRSG
jgi:hypothetical protein